MDRLRLWFSPKRNSTNGLSALPTEVWAEIFAHLEDEGLFSSAQVCRTFNRACTEISMLKYGATLPQLSEGTAVLRRPSAVALGTLRISLHLLPRLKRLSCRLTADETFFGALRSLIRTVDRSPKLESLHFGVQRTSWLEESRLDEYANLFHDLTAAMTSKGDGHVVHAEPGKREGGCGRVWVSSTRDLCREQITPAYKPLSRFQRLAAALGFKKYSKRVVIDPPEKEKAGERARWCNIAEVDHVLVGILDVRLHDKPHRLALASINPHKMLALRFRRTRPRHKLAYNYMHQKLLNEALPYLHFPRLEAVSVAEMHLDWSVFTRFLTRHAETLTLLSSESREADQLYPHVGVDPAATKSLPNVQYLRAKSCAGMLALMGAIPRDEPCTLELTFERWNSVFGKHNFAFMRNAERAVLQRIAYRTAETTLKLDVKSVDDLQMAAADLALVQSLHSVSAVHLSCMNVAVLEWLAHLPDLKVLRVDKEAQAACDEATFVKQAQVAFSSRGIFIASSKFE
ncbi:F-box domain-containing protein [Mycena chlorophos]|uniref:F-box domain-containing protein n=1 Tax=Mycena chlorophos TaxID=658473 RepID=A0A8H6WAY5_MYCCL|nr:F-box domain-containing protein [Mycena chlorophos]